MQVQVRPFPTQYIHILTIFDMALHVLPDFEAQTTNMLSHIQKGVLREVAVITGPLGSGAKMATREIDIR